MSIFIGRRKEATAVVRLKKGKGVITVNKKSIDEYFGRDVAKMIVKQPLVLAEVEQKFDIDVKVNGGGSELNLLWIKIKLNFQVLYLKGVILHHRNL